jgi:hypothetical protein
LSYLLTYNYLYTTQYNTILRNITKVYKKVKVSFSRVPARFSGGIVLDRRMDLSVGDHDYVRDGDHDYVHDDDRDAHVHGVQRVRLT